jgi:hypothetical protein
MLIVTDPPSSVSLLSQGTTAASRLTAAAARSAWHCREIAKRSPPLG